MPSLCWRNVLDTATIQRRSLSSSFKVSNCYSDRNVQFKDIQSPILKRIILDFVVILKISLKKLSYIEPKVDFLFIAVCFSNQIEEVCSLIAQ